MKTLSEEFKDAFGFELKNCINPLTGFCLNKFVANLDYKTEVSELKNKLTKNELLIIKEARLTHNF